MKPILIALVLWLATFGAPRADTLKLATWNIEWLTARPTGDPALPDDVRTRDPADFARLRAYADQLAADVVAFQEVDGPQTAARVFAPERYTIHITADHVVQRTGLAVRNGLQFTANPDLTALDLYPNAKYPLRSGADITLDLPGGRLRVLAVHLKTGCRDAALTDQRRPSCATLARQLPPLQNWIAARQSEGVPFVLLGDFNRAMEGRDRFWPALDTGELLTRATAGRSSPCWGQENFIDHIIAGGGARAWMQPDTLRVLTYRETDPAWKERLSDHCPVSVRFQIPD